jgi:hypothetical protein
VCTCVRVRARDIKYACDAHRVPTQRSNCAHLLACLKDLLHALVHVHELMLKKPLLMLELSSQLHVSLLVIWRQHRQLLLKLLLLLLRQERLLLPSLLFSSCHGCSRGSRSNGCTLLLPGKLFGFPSLLLGSLLLQALLFGPLLLGPLLLKSLLLQPLLLQPLLLSPLLLQALLLDSLSLHLLLVQPLTLQLLLFLLAPLVGRLFCRAPLRFSSTTTATR